MNDDEERMGFVFYGTPIEIPDDQIALKKPTAVHEQTATDAQGRRRFHGAFTGGYSAGYYNTVGTAEGWTPSSFKSSRKKGGASAEGDAGAGEGGRRTQRPEDFMDEEDFADNGIAPRRVAATAEFKDPSASKKRPMPSSEIGLLAGANLDELVVQPDDSVGKKLLRMLGWRDGQGVGPRRAARRSENRGGAGGEAADGDEGTDGVDDFAAARGFTFAPRDVEVETFGPKDNNFGIGYKPLNAAEYLSKGSRGQAGFGVGAFEDEDEDVYSVDDMSGYDRTTGPSARSGKFRMRAADASGVGFLQNSLKGFKLASQNTLSRKVYEPPELPKDFDPIQRFTTPGPAFAKHRSVQGAPGTQNPQGVNYQLTAHQRAVMLGERAPLPPPGLSAPPKPPPPPPPQAPTAMAPPRPPPKLNPTSLTAEKAMERGMFRPFQADPEKEARYLAFLENKPRPSRELNRREQEREIEEFQGAARLYRPMSGILANRFAPAKATNAAGLPDAKGEVQVPVPKLIDSRVEAVRQKKFGRLTREDEEWHPDRLLCKRFNVPDPYPKSALVGLISAPRRPPSFSMPRGSAGITATPAEAQHLAVKAPVVQPNPALRPPSPEPEAPPERPAMDIFKAIFSGSSSSEEEEEGNEGQRAPFSARGAAAMPVTEDRRSRAPPSRAPATKAAPLADSSRSVPSRWHRGPSPPPQEATVPRPEPPNATPPEALALTAAAPAAARPPAPLSLASNKTVEDLRSRMASSSESSGTAARPAMRMEEGADEWVEANSAEARSSSAASRKPRRDAASKKKHKKKHKKKEKKQSSKSSKLSFEYDADDSDTESVLISRVRKAGGLKALQKLL